MILKAEQIAERLETAESVSDPLIITPEPSIDKLKTSGSASIDLTLGTWFVALRGTRMSLLRITNNAQDPPHEFQLTKTYHVPFGDEFVLHPKSFVLGVTLEWVRLPKDLAAYIVGRSSWCRRGLIIATASGVHPGFTGCLTLEISNVGEIPIALMPGMAVCQLFIHQVLSTSDYVDRSLFVGKRKPILGTIEIDELARKLRP
jgi:dCTP deaminase